MKILILILFVFISSFSFAQQGLHEISLEINGLKRKPNYTRIDLFIKNDSTAIVEIRTKHLTNDMLFQRPKADTSYNMSIEQFNKVTGLFNGLSIEQLINGMNPKNPSLRSEPTGFKLTIRVMQEYIILDIVEPGYNTKERNLEPFLAICKEILLLAKLKPKEILK
ncbi:MAG: hypothetical protein PHI24_13525 [Desulfitobacteriaceae bacterium]|jgi:hypothetical protein|nr:hypothetical protein [Desulfitobacteriaceae bacterium]